MEKFSVGDVIIHSRDFDETIYTEFYQITKITDAGLVIHPIHTLYTSITEFGCDIMPIKDKFSDIGAIDSEKFYSEEYERKYLTIDPQKVGADANAYYNVDITEPFPVYFCFNEEMCFTANANLKRFSEWAGIVNFKDGEGYDPEDPDSGNVTVTVSESSGNQYEINFLELMENYKNRYYSN